MDDVTQALNQASRLAAQLHGGQVDKSGRPYGGHLERVALMVQRSGGNWVQEIAAWLHDSIEDTDASADYLIGHGVPSAAVDIVKAMTHPDGEPNREYWERVKAQPGATLVKLCDIYDNIDPSRMCYLDDETQNRLRKKYATAMLVLCD